jgi:energy-coupling factor transporter transmembrane protein EcfT
MAAALLMEGWWLAGLILVETAFGLLWVRKGLGLLRRRRFWIFVLAAVALGVFLIGEPDVVLGPFRLSGEGLAAGGEMAGRAAALALAFALGVASLTLSDVLALSARLGVRGLGFAAALAMNLLGTLQEMATVTWQTIWLRSGFRRPWTALRLFLITTIANTLRYGDEIVNAASVRAFDPNRKLPVSLPLSRADLWLAAYLALCSALFLTLG